MGSNKGGWFLVVLRRASGSGGDNCEPCGAEWTVAVDGAGLRELEAAFGGDVVRVIEY